MSPVPRCAKCGAPLYEAYPRGQEPNGWPAGHVADHECGKPWVRPAYQPKRALPKRRPRPNTPRRQRSLQDPDWRTIVHALYRHFGSYHALLDALDPHGELSVGPSLLSGIRSGKFTVSSWRTGTALLELHARVKGQQPL